MTRSSAIAASLAAVVALAGCAGGQDHAARDAARDFYQALAAQDGTSACELLATRTRSEVEQATQTSCDAGLLSEDLPQVADPDEVSVFGTMAQVRFRSPAGGPGETTFLSRYADGWRVTAAGCIPRGDQTAYDCQVSAG